MPAGRECSVESITSPYGRNRTNSLMLHPAFICRVILDWCEAVCMENLYYGFRKVQGQEISHEGEPGMKTSKKALLLLAWHACEHLSLNVS